LDGTIVAPPGGQEDTIGPQFGHYQGSFASQLEPIPVRTGGRAMSVGADAIGQNAIAAQAIATSSGKGPPPKRTLVATTDTVAQPEPR
jgi:hypothetical protein